VSHAFDFHVLKDFSGLIHLSTANAAINDRVESDDVWLTVWLFFFRWRDHDIVDFESFLKIVSSTVSFDHSCIDDSVWFDTQVFVLIID
jgi:hypothetical protein